MSRDEDRIIDEAAAWHAASAADEMDWDGFTVWLEADRRHRAAYDELALANSLIDDHREVLGAADIGLPAQEPQVLRPDFSRTSLGWAQWAGMAIAASLVAVLVVPQFLVPSPEIYQTGTAARSIALDDGSSVMLAPHSRLTVEGRQQERMALSGGAWFDIRHNPSRPLAISAGSVEISDIGTRFDVQANAGHVRIEVAEGEVKVASQALVQPIRLARGRGLLFDGKAGTALVSPVAKDSIGEWRSGRLNYVATPLPLVAADLSRYAGVRVSLSDALRDRRFSGTLVVGNGEAAIRDLSQVMGLELGREPDGYRLDQRQR